VPRRAALATSAVALLSLSSARVEAAALQCNQLPRTQVSAQPKNRNRHTARKEP